MRKSAKSNPSGIEFNFLEKLFVYQAMKTLEVPPNRIDKRIRFRVDQYADDTGITFLLHVDNEYTVLFADQGKRPDYLSVYINNTSCIFTIIELKQSQSKDALEQIQRLAGLLKEEFNKCLPPNLMPHIQGMIITTVGVQSPKLAMERMKNDLVIRHHMAPGVAEIGAFVCKRLTPQDMYQSYKKVSPTEERQLRGATFVEKMVRGEAIQEPCQHSSGIKSGCEGITIGYPEVILHANPYEKHIRLLVQNNEDLAKRLRAYIKSARLDSRIKIELVET